MTRRNTGLVMIAGGLLWQLTFALIPSDDNAFLAKIALVGWIVAMFGAVLYSVEFFRERLNKRN